MLLVKAAFLLVGFRVGLALMPFPMVVSALKRIARTPANAPEDQDSANHIVNAVKSMSRAIPGCRSCLTQSLTAKTLLSRAGFQALLRIGVARLDGRVQAHAWVESQGEILIGGEEAGNFTPLAGLEKLAI